MPENYINSKDFTEIREILSKISNSWDDVFSFFDKDLFELIILIARRRTRWSKFCFPDFVNYFVNTSLEWVNFVKSDTVKSFINNYDKALEPAFQLYPVSCIDGTLYEHYFHQLNIVHTYWYEDLEKWYISTREYEHLWMIARIHDIWEVAKWDFCKVKDNHVAKEEIDFQKLQIKKEYIEWKELINLLIKDEAIKKYFMNLFALVFGYKDEVDDFEDDASLDKLYKTFAIYEKIWYMQTAINVVQKYQENPKFMMDPLGLFYNVFANQIKLLIENQDIPSVKKFLTDNKNLITQWVDIIKATNYISRLNDANEAERHILWRILWQQTLPVL